MNTRVIATIVICLLLGACGGNEPASSPEEAELFATLEEFGALNAAGDYDKAWEFLSEARKELFNRMLTQPVTGARDTVASLRAVVEPDSHADESEKARVRKALENYPPWETLKTMTPKEFYAWRMKRDWTDEQRKSAKEYYSRQNVREIVLEGNSGYVEWMAKDSKRQYIVKESGKWKMALEPAFEREYAASKSNSEKR